MEMQQQKELIAKYKGTEIYVMVTPLQNGYYDFGHVYIERDRYPVSDYMLSKKNAEKILMEAKNEIDARISAYNETVEEIKRAARKVFRNCALNL